MKLTLLQLVQRVLNAIDSDEVNSIDDTVESSQVALTIQDCYFELISNRNWPHLRKLIRLDNVGDVTRPNYLKAPDNLKEMSFFKYEKFKDNSTRLDQQEVRYKYPDEFLRMVSGRSPDNANIQTVLDFSGTKLLVVNDQAPSYWTSFDDTYIVTDSYDLDVDTTLQGSKSQCLAYMHPTWIQTDDFIPDLPIEAFSGLLAESISTASINLKQVANAKSEQKSARQQRWLARKAWRTEGGVRVYDYGRKGRR
jgi:hypothetical protein